MGIFGEVGIRPTMGGPNLSEYAAKEWSGLIDTYYLQRWERFADSLEHGTSYHIHNAFNRFGKFAAKAQIQRESYHGKGNSRTC